MSHTFIYILHVLKYGNIFERKINLMELIFRMCFLFYCVGIQMLLQQYLNFFYGTFTYILLD